jgi:hypothetical protein
MKLIGRRKSKTPVQQVLDYLRLALRALVAARVARTALKGYRFARRVPYLIAAGAVIAVAVKLLRGKREQETTYEPPAPVTSATSPTTAPPAPEAAATAAAPAGGVSEAPASPGSTAGAGPEAPTPPPPGAPPPPPGATSPPPGAPPGAEKPVTSEELDVEAPNPGADAPATAEADRQS